MARLGTKRVDDILDYEKHIKGKGLIRLKAGVGAGKNYWVRQLPEKHPDLQILLITSRKNTASAEAIKLGTDCKIHTSRLINIQDKDWYGDLDGNLFVVTNAYIRHFFMNIFDYQKPSTHLWNKFDLIFVDEVHSLIADASFADSSFYVERFIHHTLRMNKACDIVAMSGTPESADWLFTDDIWSSKYTSIDLYDKCIHLVPDRVYLAPVSKVVKRMHLFWTQGKRQIYFVNSVKRMAELVEELLDSGVSLDDLGIAFSSSENADLLPEKLLNEKEKIRTHLTTINKLLPSVKIFITTTQNKEGISIEDDDILHMYAESHNKAELEQMAGRVRGNPETGTGLKTLAVIYDAKPHSSSLSFLEREFDRKLASQVDSVLEAHQTYFLDHGKKYVLSKDVKAVQEKHAFLRYDYISKSFQFYHAREECQKQFAEDSSFFRECVDNVDSFLYYEQQGASYLEITAGYELKRSWFPYSTVYHIADDSASPLEQAKSDIISFLEENSYIGVRLDKTAQDKILAYVHHLIQQYGNKELGFDSNLPITLGPALKRFGLVTKPADHKSTDKRVDYGTE